jgi:hypothetical protein
MLYLGRVVSAQATALEFRDAFLMFAFVSLLGIFFAILLRPPRTRG